MEYTYNGWMTNRPDSVPLTSVFRANLFDIAQLEMFLNFFRSASKLD